MRIIQRMERGGTTLVELLVVISIISILASMLFSSIARANRHARKVVCEVQRNAITRYDEGTGLRLDVPVPVLTKCYECHIPNRYRQP